MEPQSGTLPAQLPVGARILLVLAFATLLTLRMPDAVLHGRLWAEEGAVFYVRAATMPWPQALLLPYGGYLNLVANAAPIIARQVVRLEYVPWVMTGIALLFQCLPAILLVCSRDAWLRPPVTMIAALLLVATPPLVEEVWLQTLHSQFHLALCAALILALEVPRRRLALFGGLLLFLGPLCGPSAAVLLPLFLARAALERSKPRLLQALALGAGAFVQLAFFYTHVTGRSYGIGPSMLLCVIYIKQLVVPFFGVGVGEQASSALQAQIDAGSYPWQPVLVTLAVFSLCVVGLLRRRHAASTWLFVAAAVTAWIAYFGAIDGGEHLLIIGNEGRYTFLPEVLAALSLLGVASGARAPDTWIARIAVAALILVGIADLARRTSGAVHGADWLGQVALWRQDHAHPIAIWPEGWTMTLQSE